MHVGNEIQGRQQGKPKASNTVRLYCESLDSELNEGKTESNEELCFLIGERSLLTLERETLNAQGPIRNMDGRRGKLKMLDGGHCRIDRIERGSCQMGAG